MTRTTVKKQSHKNKIVSKSRTKTRTDKTTKQNAGGKKEPQKYIISEKEVKCLHCGNFTFYIKKILLNTRWATFFDTDFINKNAYVLKCDKCSFLLWFSEKPILRI